MRTARPAVIALSAVAAAAVLAGCGSSAPTRANLPAALAVEPAAAHGPSIAGGAPVVGVGTGSTGYGVPVVAAEGVGKVTGAPDTLKVVLGVETRNASAAAALSDNNNRATSLINTLEQKGVAKKDIRTDQLSIYPQYDNQGRNITGYQVDDTVTATLHDLGGAGGVIDAAAAAAGDAIRVQSVGFSIDDDSALRAAARTQAVTLAHDQADQMAKAAGARLGRILSISETPGFNPQPYQQSFKMAAPTGSVAAPSAPLEPGTEQLTLTVDVVYELVQ